MDNLQLINIAATEHVENNKYRESFHFVPKIVYKFHQNDSVELVRKKLIVDNSYIFCFAAQYHMLPLEIYKLLRLVLKGHLYFLIEKNDDDNRFSSI